MNRLITLMIGAALVGAACSSSGGDEISTADSSTTAATVTTSTTTPPEATTTSESTTTTETTVPTTGLPDDGELIDYGPEVGTELSVIGVGTGDHLNFRTGPSTSFEVVDTAAPLDDSPSILSLGETWLGPSTAWWHLIVNGHDAWASTTYLGVLGQVDNIGAEVKGSVSSAATMEELALAVADTRASTEPKSRVVIVSTADTTSSDLGEIVVDVIGLGDDAMKGERLHIFANLIYSADGASLESVEVMEVERTIICGRGVSAGLCL